MIVNHQNEKLANAIIYFVENTKSCGKTKLFKLLYFLDFEHYSQTGRSVTGLDYYAWPKGPVPVRIFNEIDSPSNELKDAIQVTKKQTFDGKSMNNIVPIKEFSSEHFSKRELNLIKQLSEEYFDSYANDMIEATHLENQPWHQIYEIEESKQGLISYKLALKKSEYEQIIKNAIENDEFQENYK
ncbi:Panacea domain-containing protein [Candidatus Thiosymbion oneisti]|uniref:Panacea domain-containing protein n=1 Tax=Candidatus Thiosymbion oneisti TaxID=589554 RepID=UPI000B2B0CF9|nr:Panacea domain-containing protein [Candidatus Thiosymbion oneisti]